ncbi:MAG: TonB-dependent vitamin B12 receptor [Gammaproteobacteria bacterium]|nr:TonB-dependent vitamin B12 receptor [Gammaproteobacteria bacterium]
MKYRLLSAVPWLMLGASGVCAVELNPVVVTATRTAVTADDTLASVSVITRDDIERQQAQSVEELLRGLPGVSVTRNGGLGKVATIFLRGSESDQVLVLIDGIKVGSASIGATAFHDLPVHQIERIEIVRGPRSSLYGSEAIGGVIQIFTRKGGGEIKPNFSLGGGSHDTIEATAGISGGGERGWFNINLSGLDTDGFNSCDGEPGVAGCFTTEPDRDGYRNESGSLRAGYRFENGVEFDAHALRSSADSDFDGGFQNESETAQQVLGASLSFSPIDLWRISLTAGQSRDESDYYKDGAFVSRFDTKRDTLTLQNDLTISDDHMITLGGDYQEDQVDTTAYRADSRDNTGLFAQYQGTLAEHDLQLSLRNDDNEQFGDRTTGSAAWGYRLSDGLRLSLSYGTAFKAPTFNELYFPFFGNLDLQPEESESVELGLYGQSFLGGWSVNIYETTIEDMIAYDANSGLAANIDKARIRGLEATLTTSVSDWDLNASLTLLDPENRSVGANDGNQLPRRAKRGFRLDADRRFGQFALGATLHAEGKRFDDLGNTREIGGYATLDLRAEYSFAPDWRLQLRIENLFDENYETASFYNQPGTSAFLTLRYQP